ncbi:MAG: NFYB/HAP3 family transcription factor subunit [Thermoplasmata archaeon]|nr:NFYB/HAP3 family transcription factor subunit [Thermoplasmata archaeon]
MPELFVSPVRRLLRRGGAARVRPAGTLYLRKALEEYATRIGEEAISICNEDGRKIIKATDIEEATLRLKPKARTFESDQQTVLFRAPVRRIMKRAGAERISGAVIDWMKDELEDYARRVAEDAVSLRRYGGIVLKDLDIAEAARSGGVYPKGTAIPIEILVGERWVETGRHLPEESTIRIDRTRAGKVRLWHVRRGEREVIAEVPGDKPCELLLPALPKRPLLAGDVMHTLECGDLTEEIVLIPKGYGEESMRNLIRIAIEAQFRGLELNHGAIFLPSGFHEQLMARGYALSREYGNIVAYHLLKREIMGFLRR